MQRSLFRFVLLRPVEEEVLIVCLLLVGGLVILLKPDILEEDLCTFQHLGEENRLFLASSQIPLLHILHLGLVFLMTDISVQQVLLGSNVGDVVASKVEHALMNVIYVSPIVGPLQLRLGLVVLQLRHGLVPKLSVAAACLFGDAVWCTW